MKKIFLAFVVLLTATIVNAQKNSTDNPTVFSLGVEASVPVGEFNNLADYNTGIGASAQVAHKVASDITLTLYAGYLKYNQQGSSTDKYHLTEVPLLAGAKFWFSPKVYAQGQLGVAFNSIKYSTISTTVASATAFAYSPGVGFVLAKNIDVVIKYLGNSMPANSTFSRVTLGSFGARLAYNFLHRK